MSEFDIRVLLYLLRSDTTSLAWAKERMIEAADEIERLRAINVNLVNNHNTLNQDGARLEGEIRHLRAINDELVSGLRDIRSFLANQPRTPITDEIERLASAALAKARGEQT